jgi:predicted HTH transcriptional regulator
MTNQEIAEFLETAKVQIQLAMDEKFRPVYKSNTWLKQKDLTVTERVIMQLADERNNVFSNKWLCEQTGFSSKCIRENLTKLMERRLVKKIGNTRNYKTISIV